MKSKDIYVGEKDSDCFLKGKYLYIRCEYFRKALYNKYQSKITKNSITNYFSERCICKSDQDKNVIKYGKKGTRYLVLNQSLLSHDAESAITKCYYVDKEINGCFYEKPKSIKTFSFASSELISLINSELDGDFYEYAESKLYMELSEKDFIKLKVDQNRKKNGTLEMTTGYIMKDNMLYTAKARFWNRLHRYIYLEMIYFANGEGVIADCHYCDVDYKTKGKVVPDTLTTTYFEFSNRNIIDIVNKELNADFTDVIFIL